MFIDTMISTTANVPFGTLLLISLNDQFTRWEFPLETKLGFLKTKLFMAGFLIFFDSLHITTLPTVS